MCVRSKTIPEEGAVHLPSLCRISEGLVEWLASSSVLKKLGLAATTAALPGGQERPPARVLNLASSEGGKAWPTMMTNGEKATEGV